MQKLLSEIMLNEQNRKVKEYKMDCYFLHWQITGNHPCLQACTLNDTRPNNRMTFTA